MGEYKGTLTHVYDNETKTGKPNWALMIDTEEKGPTKFQLWSKRYAGMKNEAGEDADCDVHEMIDMAVVFNVKRGNLKDKNDPNGERWPSIIESICLDEPMEKSVLEMMEEAENAAEKPLNGPQSKLAPEPDQEPVKLPIDRLRRATMDAIGTETKAHEARVAMLLEVERIAREVRDG